MNPECALKHLDFIIPNKKKFVRGTNDSITDFKSEVYPECALLGLSSCHM
jgi:hypothetical protein